MSDPEVTRTVVGGPQEPVAETSVQVTQADQSEETRKHRGLWIGAGVALGAVVLVGAGYGLVSCDTGPENRTVATDGTGAGGEVASDCDNLTFNQSPVNQVPTKYSQTGALPKNSVNSAEQVQPAVTALFGESGPAGGTADPYSLALIEGTITMPAKDNSVAVATSIDYMNNINSKIGVYKSGDVETAKADCKASRDVMTQVAGYNANWATSRDKVVQFVALRDTNNNIIGFKPTPKSIDAGKTLAVIEYVNNDSSRGINGFPSVGQDSEGNWYVKGITFVPEQGQTNGEQQPQPQQNEANGQTGGTANQGTGTNSGAATGNRSGTQSGSGNGEGTNGGGKGSNGSNGGNGGGSGNGGGNNGGSGGNGGGNGGNNGGNGGGGTPPGGGGGTPPGGGGETPPPTHPPTNPPTTPPGGGGKPTDPGQPGA